MELKKIVLAMAMMSGVVATGANAADSGSGKVTFNGSVIEAACSVKAGDDDKVVELGQIASSALVKGGTSVPRNFTIELENCDISSLTDKTVTSTWTGASAAGVNGALGVTGTAKNIGIVLTAGDGAPIVLGTPSSAQKLQDGNNTLSFSAYVKGSSTENATAGNFTGVANYTLAYQ